MAFCHLPNSQSYNNHGSEETKHALLIRVECIATSPDVLHAPLLAQLADSAMANKTVSGPVASHLLTFTVCSLGWTSVALRVVDTHSLSFLMEQVD